MYENGKNIYDTMNMFSNIPSQVQTDKMNQIFNTDNDIKTQFFNDTFINNLQRNSSLTQNQIITHIIECLKPIIYQNKSYNLQECKDIISNTLSFKITYMVNIDTQLDFLFSDNTKQYIKECLYNKLPETYEVKNTYIDSILKNQIDKHNKSSRETQADNISVRYNVYINKATKFTERELFHILDNTINSITSRIRSEYNNTSNNIKLDKWNTVLGHNNNDITQNINIKLNTKKPKGMQFNMTY